MPEQTYTEDIRNGKPIECYGLTFYPIRMNRYSDYQDAKPALLIRQGTLPAEYASMPYLEAMWEKEKESITTTGEAAGIIGRILLLIGMALGIDYKTCVKPLVDKDQNHKLIGLKITQGEIQATIPTTKFTRIRKLLVEQNGDHLPDESENADIVEAEQAIAEMESPNLQYDEETLIDSVAHNCGKRYAEVMEWTIREFTIRKNTIDLNKRFEICAYAESGGMVKWKGGNPYPHWAYKRERASGALMDAKSWKKGISAVVGDMGQGQLPQE